MTDQAKFTLLGETVRARGSMVTMATRHFRGPDGSVFDRDVVHHPGAVAVVPLLDDGRVILVRQFRTPLNRETLELPAGVRDKDGEEPVECAARELREETGYRAEKIEELCVTHTAPGFSDEEITLFVARGLTPGDNEADGVEEQHMSAAAFGFDQIDEMIRSGELTDAKTILATCLLRQRGI